MMVTWVTFAANISSSVEFGIANEPLEHNASGFATKFVDGGSEKRTMFVHRVKLTELKPSTYYGNIVIYTTESSSET